MKHCKTTHPGEVLSAAHVARPTSPSIKKLIAETGLCNLHMTGTTDQNAMSKTTASTIVRTVLSAVTEDDVPISSDYLKAMSHQTVNSTAEDAELQNLTDNWKTGKLTNKRLENFATTILPSNIQVQLAQPFGKDSQLHHFHAQKCFRHILLPVLKSVFLSCRVRKTLEKSCRCTRQLQLLRKKYSKIDFLPLQGFQADWETTTTIRDDWKKR